MQNLFFPPSGVPAGTLTCIYTNKEKVSKLIFVQGQCHSVIICLNPSFLSHFYPGRLKSLIPPPWNCVCSLLFPEQCVICESANLPRLKCEGLIKWFHRINQQNTVFQTHSSPLHTYLPQIFPGRLKALPDFTLKAYVFSHHVLFFCLFSPRQQSIFAKTLFYSPNIIFVTTIP